MAKPEWGVRRKCISCGAAFYDFRKENPVCPKCGTLFEHREIIEDLENEEDDIPENDDEIILDEMESMEEDEDDDYDDEDDDYAELDVEEDLIHVDPHLVNDDDIDNVFIEGSDDISEVESGLHDKFAIDGDDRDI